MRNKIALLDSQPSIYAREYQVAWRRNIYDSPRVVRAVLEDMMEHLASELYQQMVPYAIQYARNVIGQCLNEIDFRGTRLDKLIALDPIVEGSNLVFHFRKVSDDGEWLLRQLDMIHETPQVPTSYIEKMSVKRVVDL